MRALALSSVLACVSALDARAADTNALYRAYVEDLRAVNASLPKGTELRVPPREQLEIAPFEQTLLPGVELFVAGGTYNGGHRFYPTRVLVVRGGRVWMARNPSSEGPDRAPGIHRALACTPAYLRAVAALLAGHDPAVDVERLQKRECLDLTAPLVAAVARDLAPERVAQLVAIAELLHLEEEAGVLMRPEELDPMLRQILDGRKPAGGTGQSSGKAVTLAPMRIEPAASGAGFTARGFLTRSHRTSSVLESFVLTVDEKSFSLVGEVVARFDGYIE